MSAKLHPGRLDAASIVRLAWRNLTRNRRRTLITSITVAFAVMMLQVTASMLAAFERQSFDNLISYQTAHAKLYAAGYFDHREDFSLDFQLTDWDRLKEVVEDIPGVAAATPRLLFSVQVSDGIDQIPGIGTGIKVTGSDSDVFRIRETIQSGRYLEPGEEALLVGGGLAEMFGLEINDWLTVLVRTRDGAYEALDLPVVGFLGTGNPAIDQGSILMPLETARIMLDLEDSATELSIRFAQGAREYATLKRVASSLSAESGIDVKGWREIEEDFMSLARMERAGTTIFLGIFVLLAVVGVANTILMATFERTREIGMIMALGLRGSGIQRLFLTEGVLIGLFSGAIGTIVGLIIVGIFSVHGMDLSAIYGDLDIGYPIKDVIYFPIDAGIFGMSWLLAGVLAALAAYFPSHRASRQDPVDALRHV